MVTKVLFVNLFFGRFLPRPGGRGH
jgi:hypothetical protein